MASITQAPTELDITGVSGGPFNLQFNVTATDASGDPIPWSDITSPFVTVTNALRVTTGVQPTVTTPESGEILIAWTAAQTELLEEMDGTQWCLWVTIEGSGPNALVSGNLSMTTPTAAGY